MDDDVDDDDDNDVRFDLQKHKRQFCFTVTEIPTALEQLLGNKATHRFGRVCRQKMSAIHQLSFRERSHCCSLLQAKSLK